MTREGFRSKIHFNLANKHQMIHIQDPFTNNKHIKVYLRIWLELF